MEEKYWELREAEDRAFDRYVATVSDEDRAKWIEAKEKFHLFCVELLEKLMEENSDVLMRLKN